MSKLFVKDKKTVIERVFSSPPVFCDEADGRKVNHAPQKAGSPLIVITNYRGFQINQNTQGAKHRLAGKNVVDISSLGKIVDTSELNRLIEGLLKIRDELDSQGLLGDDI